MYIPSHLSLHPLPPSHPSGLSQRSRLGSLLFSNFPRNNFTHAAAAAAAAAAAKSLQSCPTLCNPIAAHQAPPSLGFSRQEHWSGLPFPSLIHESESEVAQSCPTSSYPMDCSLPGSSIHGIFQAGVLEWGAIAFSNICQCYFLNSSHPHLPPLCPQVICY